ncbi:protein tyrosine phosphatase [Thalassoporum mexicanum PCC 7367]|uniref:low molecular weight protein-tyrosine-phosphatase n=1 Tax=Thalassoporum mexicanum TaxID=3457544 RepID=UPI00029FF105|nr:low molecular weight protein-tyrosine-phosphatase [Pseudanabaena sp. PCC 7367]AFY70440.1 protein tyrosine phosphatase [Pseudanabaena sp. PCC 7367]
MPQKLLFVCLGNICRSPSAENIMNELVAQAGLEKQIICDSAGTGAYHVGEPPDRRMSYAASQRGLQLKGRARQFVVDDFESFDRIFAMDRSNYQNILRLDPQGKYKDKVELICSYCSEHNDSEVPDPYYGGDAGFDYVLDLLYDACGNLLSELEEQV